MPSGSKRDCAIPIKKLLFVHACATARSAECNQLLEPTIDCCCSRNTFANLVQKLSKSKENEETNNYNNYVVEKFIRNDSF